MALRMKSLMTKIIATNQSAFIEGCQIQDNLLIVHEGWNYCKDKRMERKIPKPSQERNPNQICATSHPNLLHVYPEVPKLIVQNNFLTTLKVLVGQLQQRQWHPLGQLEQHDQQQNTWWFGL